MKPVDLMKHPEGGRFREVFRSETPVAREDGTKRSALTHIYFSLEKGEVSRFHRVDSDEVWNLYQGDGVVLYTWDGTLEPPRSVVLSVAENRFCHVVPAGVWQAAEPLSGTVLVGCSVAPGFEFQDFTLIDPFSDMAERLVSLDPSLGRFIHPLSV